MNNGALDGASFLQQLEVLWALEIYGDLPIEPLREVEQLFSSCICKSAANEEADNFSFDLMVDLLLLRLLRLGLGGVSSKGVGIG